MCVCYLFLYLFICAPQLHSLDCQHFVHYISLVLFTFLMTPHGCRVSFLKGTYNFLFSKLFKMTICKGMCTLKCTEKRVILFTPLHLLNKFVPPIQNLKEALPMTHRMYSIVHLSKIIRLSAFKSPLFYPSS
jgi:hypothetical protein